MAQYDICVFGAGPAGAVIAKKLAAFGYSVVIVNNERNSGKNIALSLTPGINHWIDTLGIREQVNKAGFTRALTSMVIWEDSIPVRKDFPADAAGYHVSKNEFGHILLSSAEACGVTIFQHCSCLAVGQDVSGKWKIEFMQGSGVVSLSVAFIVEATGRQSVMKGTKKPYLPATLATYAYWNHASVKDAVSVIEAGENHWYWGAPVSNAGFFACIFSDPADLKYASLTEFYLNTIKRSQLLAPLLKQHECKSISVCTATPCADIIPVCHNYIKIGDAAFSMDPLSAQGVQKAIKTAVQGAVVVNTLLSQPQHAPLAIDFYNSLIAAEIKKNTKWTKQYYNKQCRYTSGAFWQKRKDVSVKPTQERTYSTIAVNKESRLMINRKAVITFVPVVGKLFIENEAAIVLEGNEQPFVFLEGISLVALVQKMHNQQLIPGLTIIQSTLPQSDAMEVLRWLLYNQLLCLY